MHGEGRVFVSSDETERAERAKRERRVRARSVKQTSSDRREREFLFSERTFTERSEHASFERSENPCAARNEFPSAPKGAREFVSRRVPYSIPAPQARNPSSTLMGARDSVSRRAQRAFFYRPRARIGVASPLQVSKDR